jgi:hypothetical protein
VTEEIRSSENVVEETWLAYALGSPQAEGEIEAGLARVEAHYGALVDGGLRRSEDLGPAHGLVLWRPDQTELRWPLWWREEPLAMASTGVPVGWESVTGECSFADAPAELAKRLDADPERAGALGGPIVIGVRNAAEDRLRIVNDSLGIGRLYEMQTEDGWIWSNRLGALPIFAGTRPEADARGWSILAAAGWFLGDSTPIRGTRKIPPGTVIDVRGGEVGAQIDRRETGVREERLVAPRGRGGLGDVGPAANQVAALARSLGEAWTVPPAIDLSGGRDSRVSAAGAIKAGVDARFKTGDNEDGEVDLVKRLVAAAPRELDHTVNKPEAEETADDLDTRLAAIHLVHDGMRNPQEVRRPTRLPHAAFVPPSMSGHGGEIGHGFYYANRRALFQLRRGGTDGLVERLMTNARRGHAAATAAAYEAYRAECERVMAAGGNVGLKGPSLLDYFYLAERMPYRSGLGARSGRYSACVVPEFVRAAFDMKPSERLKNKLHTEVVAALVPEWREIPFFVSGSGRMPATRRTRIWEKEDHAAEIERMLDAGRGWTEMFDADRIRGMWEEVRSGGGSANYEHVFYRLVWRVGYEEHLERLARAASA